MLFNDQRFNSTSVVQSQAKYNLYTNTAKPHIPLRNQGMLWVNANNKLIYTDGTGVDYDLTSQSPPDFFLEEAPQTKEFQNIIQPQLMPAEANQTLPPGLYTQDLVLDANFKVVAGNTTEPTKISGKIIIEKSEEGTLFLIKDVIIEHSDESTFELKTPNDSLHFENVVFSNRVVFTGSDPSHTVRLNKCIFLNGIKTQGINTNYLNSYTTSGDVDIRSNPMYNSTFTAQGGSISSDLCSTWKESDSNLDVILLGCKVLGTTFSSGSKSTVTYTVDSLTNPPTSTSEGTFKVHNQANIGLSVDYTQVPGSGGGLDGAYEISKYFTRFSIDTVNAGARLPRVGIPGSVHLIRNDMPTESLTIYPDKHTSMIDCHLPGAGITLLPAGDSAMYFYYGEGMWFTIP